MVPQSIIPLINDPAMRKWLAGTLSEDQLNQLVLATHPAQANTLRQMKETLFALCKEATISGMSISSNELILNWRSSLLLTVIMPISDFQTVFLQELCSLLQLAQYEDRAKLIRQVQAPQWFQVGVQEWLKVCRPQALISS